MVGGLCALVGGLAAAWATSPADPPDTVVVIVVDTVNRDYLSGFHPSWDTTPALASLWGRGTVLENVLSVRGVTTIAVTTIQTGTYPRTHQVRTNLGWPLPDPRFRLLPERFQDAGYDTFGYAANACQFLDRGMDEAFCSDEITQPGANGLERDRTLLEMAAADLVAQPEGRPLFQWIHLIAPHSPYRAQDEYLGEFYDGIYTGEVDPSSEDSLEGVTLGRVEVTDDDLAYVRAAYASELKGLDAALGDYVAALEGSGRGGRALVALGADHGEELAEHDLYFFHGCSPYNGVAQVAWGLVGPGVPAQRLDGWVSQTDLAATLVELAGLEWSGPLDGRSLVGELEAGRIDEVPVFFERGEEAAGVIAERQKYVRDEQRGFADCRPFGPNRRYPGQLNALYDLELDPAETTEIGQEQPSTMKATRRELCAWVTAAPWQDAAKDEENALVLGCRDFLASLEPEPSEPPPPEVPALRHCGCAATAGGAALPWSALAGALVLGLGRRRGASLASPIRGTMRA